MQEDIKNLILKSLIAAGILLVLYQHSTINSVQITWQDQMTSERWRDFIQKNMADKKENVVVLEMAPESARATHEVIH